MVELVPAGRTPIELARMTTRPLPMIVIMDRGGMIMMIFKETILMMIVAGPPARLQPV